MTHKTNIPDWRGFQKGDIYIAATGGGDGWEGSHPISAAIKRDIQDAADAAYPDDTESDAIQKVDWRDWISDLTVVRPIGDDMCKEVAQFDLDSWQWQKGSNSILAL